MPSLITSRWSGVVGAANGSHEDLREDLHHDRGGVGGGDFLGVEPLDEGVGGLDVLFVVHCRPLAMLCRLAGAFVDSAP